MQPSKTDCINEINIKKNYAADVADQVIIHQERKINTK